MSRFVQMSGRRALVLLGAFIVVGGFVVGLWSGLPAATSGTFSGGLVGQPPLGYTNGISVPNASGIQPYPGYTQGVGTTEAVSSSTVMTTTSYGGSAQQTSSNGTGTGGSGSLLEFSSTLNIEVNSPQSTAGQVVALAYELGGYVAFQSTYQSQAEVVIRVPAAQYQLALARIQGYGKVVGLSSNSNDVTVQYTDLNATLASLRTEESALLRLLNQSANINTTLAIENSLQGVDAQINSIESQILQTKTLVTYSTIDVTISETQQAALPLTIVLKAAPENGTAPFSVTFNAIVKGGAQPYVVNFDFGDGSTYQGQILIHTYTQAGDFKVTVTATDLNGTVVIASAKIHVDAPPGQGGVGGFLGGVASLFVNVVEGIVEVAVVVLPLAAVGAVVWFPFRKRFRSQKEIRQS